MGPAIVRNQQGDIVEKFEQTYPLNRNGRVNVSNINGSITIEGWDRNEVRLEATKIADSRETMAMLELKIDSQPDSFCVETELQPGTYNDVSGRSKNRRLEVQFKLWVPKGAVLNEIGAVNGPVSVSDFTNVTKVSAVNGPIMANNLRGTVKLSTVNGEVRVGFERLDAGTSVALDTVNGRVNLEVPSDVNATIKADSLNGSITNDFGLPVKKGKYVGRNLHGRIGSGDVQIKLSAVNGGLTIGRKRDGKPSNTVTNLLKSDSDDEEDTEDSEVEVERAGRAAEEAFHKSTKVAEKSLKETQKTIEKIKPQVEKIKVEAPENMKVDTKVWEKTIAGAMWPTNGSGLIDAYGNPPTSVEQRSKTVEFKGMPKVSVEAPPCKVRVRGWDQPNVKYVLTEGKGARSLPLNISESATDNSLTLKIFEKNNGLMQKGLMQYAVGDRFVQLDVFVPRKTDLRVVSESDIRIEGVSGEIDITGEDGEISVRDSAGGLKLASEDGLVRVVGFKGGLDLKTDDAEVYLEGDFDRIDSCSSGANITLTIPADRNVSISTNRTIESEGLKIVRENGQTWRLGHGGPKYDFEFTDGRLVVRDQSIIDTN